MHLISLFAIFPLVVSIPLFSQAVPSAYSGGGPAIVVGAGRDWLKRCAGAAPWASRLDLRVLIGSNWKP